MTDEELKSYLDENVSITIRGREQYTVVNQVDRKLMSFANGVSKNCIIPKNSSFVIKFPKQLNKKISDCEKECQFYAESHSIRIDKILLPTTVFYTSPCGITFYKQRKMDYCVADTPYTKIEKYQRMTVNISDEKAYKISGSCHDEYGFDVLWLKMVWLLYGEKFARAFEKWTHDKKINDLHSHNRGYLNDKPVVLDFSGYHG